MCRSVCGQKARAIGNKYVACHQWSSFAYIPRGHQLCTENERDHVTLRSADNCV